MNDKNVNKIESFALSLTLLDQPENQPIWLDQEPVIFTTKVREAVQMLAEIHGQHKDQESTSTGFTSEKDREEHELEEAAFRMAQALLNFAEDHQQEGLGSDFALSRSAWTQLRDQQLLAKTAKLIETLEGVAGGAMKEDAVKFGISAKSIGRLTKERDDYVQIVNAPTSVIAVRAALTKGIPSALRLVQGRMNQLDGLILQFDHTAAGRKLIAAWKSTRIIRDLGHGKREEAAAMPPSSPAAA